MSKIREGIDEKLADWIRAQPMYFVGTAPLAADGHLNVSPKGLAGTFAVLGPDRVAYLDFTGSGVETIAHLRENARIVIMFCAFAGPPQIVRLHGRGIVHLNGAQRFSELRENFSPVSTAGERSIVEVVVDRISDSCGFAVPLMTLNGHRDLLDQWAERKSAQELTDYQATRNAASIDGLPGLRNP